jgi:glycosyltransferase involved in cell wall biosynthesis
MLVTAAILRPAHIGAAVASIRQAVVSPNRKTKKGSKLKLSILTPSYGYGRFMSDCVKSVLMQEEVDVEHVIMDGGSNDETVQILESLSGDSRLRWVSEPDGGQSDALNKAFSMSTGDWIGWLNVDEFYLPGALSRVVDCIQENPTTDLIYGDFTEVDADGRLGRLVAEHDFSGKVLQSLCYIPSCTTFIKRKAMPARLWDIQCGSMMDWDLFLELYRAGKKFTYLKHPLAAFRVHADQVSASSMAQSHEEFSLIRSRHGIPMGASALRTAKAVGRSAHIARKVVEGGYVREVKASRVKGRSLKWFEQVDAEALNSLGLRCAQTFGE